jgi:hypothetical protein
MFGTWSAVTERDLRIAGKKRNESDIRAIAGRIGLQPGTQNAKGQLGYSSPRVYVSN